MARPNITAPKPVFCQDDIRTGKQSSTMVFLASVLTAVASLSLSASSFMG